MILFYWLVSIMPLAQHPLWSMFVGQLTLTKYIGLACLLYAAVYLAGRGTFPRAWRASLTRWLLLFYALQALSRFTRSLPNPFEMDPLLSYTSFVLLFFVTVSVVDSPLRLRWTLLVAIGSVALASLYVLREWQKYHDVLAGFRPGFVVGDANYYTLSAVLCLPLAFYWMRGERPAWERFYCLGCVLVTLAGVSLAASRGGFLGLVAAFVLVIWRSERRARNFLLVAALSVPLLLLLPLSPLDRLLHPNYSDTFAQQSRIEMWKAGLRMIQDHPFAGIGLGNFKDVVGGYEEPGARIELIAHNTYIEIAAETGIPALIAFLAIFLSALGSLKRARLEASEDSSLIRTAALGAEAGLVGGMVAIFFLSSQSQKLLWFMVFLAPVLEALAFETEPERQESEEPGTAAAWNRWEPEDEQSPYNAEWMP